MYDFVARRFLHAAQRTEWSAFFVAALCTGARRAEVAALRWSSIDFDHGVATIAGSVVRTRSGLEFKKHKDGTGPNRSLE